MPLDTNALRPTVHIYMLSDNILSCFMLTFTDSELADYVTEHSLILYSFLFFVNVNEQRVEDYQVYHIFFQWQFFLF